MKIVLSLIFSFSLLISFLTFGGVNLKNGNFYLSFVDLNVPGGGNDISIKRTYNSKSIENGWWGVGWGSYYETKLIPAPDGSVVIKENGTGAETRFISKQGVDVDTAVKKIIEAMRKKGAISDSAANELTAKLKNNADLRLAYSEKYEVKSALAVGTTLYSGVRGPQTVEKIATGYKRIFNDGKVEHFSEAGDLVLITDKNGYKQELVYKNGKLDTIKDNQSKVVYFAWGQDGYVKEVWSTDNKKATFKYDGVKLVGSKDVSDNSYDYTYDANFNLTELKYADGTKMKMEYTKTAQWVTKVVDRDGEVSEYEYGSDPKNPELHYWTTVKKVVPGGEPTSSRYEYEIRTKPDGSQYTYKIATEVNGIKTETIYSECCSLPLSIVRGNQKTSFTYNDKGLLLEKMSSDGEFVKLDYDEKINKIKKVVNNEGWTTFVYDKGGNLELAQNSAGKSVQLHYNHKGEITKMIDKDPEVKDKRVLEFEYDALGKPVEIRLVDIGKINVMYDNYGEIKKVDSKQGQQMALQVTQAFQSLLSIVKPAGVDLNL